MIAVEGLSHRYPGAARDALHEVDFHVPRGALAGLLGPNGAGKSTLLSILTGVTPVQHGHVEVAGRTPGAGGRIAAAGSLVPQSCAFYDTLTVRENLAFFAGIHGVTGPAWSRRLSFCVDVAVLDEVLDQRAGTLSGGQRRRLNLALGLVNGPDILYLDEPTVGVDAESRQCITAAIGRLRDAGTTIVYTSHYMEEVESLCDRLTVIDRGRTVASGATEALLARYGGTSMEVMLRDAPDEAGRARFKPWSPVWLDARTVRLSVADTASAAAVLRMIDEHGIVPERARYGIEHLEDVYFQLLGRRDVS